MADVGRPTVMTEETLRKLESAFIIGATDIEACLVADISTESLYAYIRENPEYSERKEELKHKPKLTARKNIVKALDDGDIDTSKWYAERKGKDEFSQRTETTPISKVGDKEVTQEEIELAKQILEQRRTKTTSEQGTGIDTIALGGEVQD